MEKFNSLSHSRYDCKYHIVFVPKFRKKSLFGKIRQYLKGVFHELARQKGSEIVSGHMASDHVHMCVSIPPKYAVSEVIGYLKGKSGAPRGASVAGSGSLPKENSAICT
ncbi:MAG: hypothetical protein MAG551_00076 [Candidatus Scalindua arabica]|uniref:Transposase IS200-like domain-containing protein n=1 Tax=Candidatus Scalindua arabica TaxID=1127984 RepID=A0A942A0F1_9BACT|nr:hypothetical protein [Candidatus Scalindua arabica]